MAAKQLNAGVLLAGGAAALAGYQFIIKPWLASQAAAGGGAMPTLYPSPTVTTPTTVGPALTPSTGGQYQGSIVDPRTSPGGDVGQAMWRKNWTQAYATQRISDLKAAAAQAVATLANLKRAEAPSAAVQNQVQQGMAHLARLEQVAATDRQNQANAIAAGDQAAAAAWGQAAADHEAQAGQQRALIATVAANSNVDNAAAIAAWEGALAGHRANYLALTGYQLAV